MVTVAVRKTADEGESSLLPPGLQNDDHLFFAVAANERWTFEFFLSVLGDESGDIRVELACDPGPCNTIGAVARWLGNGPTVGEANPTSVGAHNRVTISTAATGPPLTAFGTGGTTANVNNSDQGPVAITLSGTFVNGATPTTFRLQWARNTPTGTTTVQANSYLVARRVSP